MDEFDQILRQLYVAEESIVRAQRIASRYSAAQKPIFANLKARDLERKLAKAMCQIAGYIKTARQAADYLDRRNGR